MLVLFQIVSGAICLLHSMSGRTVRVVFTPFKVTGAVELEFLFKWQGIELPPQSELVVDLFLTDVEVLHIEESCFQILISTKPKDQVQLKCSGAQERHRLTNISNSMIELLDKFFLSSWLFILVQVQCDEFGPVN